MIKKHGPIKLTLLTLDALLCISAFCTAYFLRFQKIPVNFSPGGLFLFMVMPVHLLLHSDLDLYKHRIYTTRAEHALRILQLNSFLFLYIFVLELFLRLNLFHQSRMAIFYFMAFSFLFSISFRVLIFSWIYPKLTRNTMITRKSVIVGTGRYAELTAGRILGDELTPVEIIGFINGPGERRKEELFSKPVLGSLSSLKKIAGSENPDLIIMAFNNVDNNVFYNTYDICKKTGLPVLIATEHFKIVTDKLRNNEYESIVGVRITNYNHSVVELIIKRGIDIILSSIALLLLSPLFLCIGLAIKYSSPGPIFFRQKRLGKNAEPFIFYKFRSMRTNNDDTIHRAFLNKFIRENSGTKSTLGKRVFKMADDPRVTFVGKWLRKFSIDELPQLWNVMKGNMSLVGPRPCLDYEYAMYQEWHKRRLNVTPGITGIWQIRGRSAVNFDDMVALDLFYVENWSIWMDIKILLQTVPVVLWGKGAH